VNTGFAYRNAGLGRRLVSEVFEIGRRHGLKKMTAMMTPDQTGARAVFEKLGFQVEAILADWVEDRRGQPRDLLVMSYDLEGFSDHLTA
jgi:ribosomal protein S18 acetylase RimI-like enzyme